MQISGHPEGMLDICIVPGFVIDLLIEEMLWIEANLLLTNL